MGVPRSPRHEDISTLQAVRHYDSQYLRNAHEKDIPAWILVTDEEGDDHATSKL
jgi:hypothetical protein